MEMKEGDSSRGAKTTENKLSCQKLRREWKSLKFLPNLKPCSFSLYITNHSLIHIQVLYVSFNKGDTFCKPCHYVHALLPGLLLMAARLNPKMPSVTRRQEGTQLLVFLPEKALTENMWNTHKWFSCQGRT